MQFHHFLFCFLILLGLSCAVPQCTCPGEKYTDLPKDLALVQSQPKVNLTGKVAIITGSSRGMGRELALKLADKGVRVFGFSRSLPCDNTSLPLGRQSPLITNYQVDIKRNWQVAASIAQVKLQLLHEGREPKVDIFILNAGLVDYIFFQDAYAAIGSKIFETNFIGNWRVFHQAYLLNMTRFNGYSRIGWTSSINADFFAFPAFFYGPSKAAINEFSKQLNNIFLDTGLRSYTINPDFVSTQLSFHAQRSFKETCPQVFEALSGPPLFFNVPTFEEQREDPLQFVDNCKRSIIEPGIPLDTTSAEDIADAHLAILEQETMINYHYSYQDLSKTINVALSPSLNATFRDWVDWRHTANGVDYNQAWKVYDDINLLGFIDRKSCPPN